jgi:hypothetical protein
MKTVHGVFVKGFDIKEALDEVKEVGYFFVLQAITNLARVHLEKEIRSLLLEEGSHVAVPINTGKKTEVRQQHERFYCAVGDSRTPAATLASKGIMQAIHAVEPELNGWSPTEVGYQRYRNSDDWISPHRDRRTDEKLAVTLTLRGSAVVRVFEPFEDPDDYSPTNLRVIDEFRTASGSLMMLRAPGYGSGGQIIHEVLPPEHGVRNILNLRMRPDVLTRP